MQKDLKGGYQLISLGMVAIASIAFIEPELLKTTKRIVLTGISLDGKIQLPDKTVDIEPRGSGVVGIKNVYGYDLIVDANGSVDVTETSTGSTLFEHTITFLTPADSERVLKIINNDSEPITLNTNSVREALLSALKYEVYNDEDALLLSSNDSFVTLNSSKVSFIKFDGVTTVGEDDTVTTGSEYTRIDSFTGSDTVTKY